MTQRDERWLLDKLRKGGGEDEEFKPGEDADTPRLRDAGDGAVWKGRRYEFRLGEKLGAGAYGSVYRGRTLGADDSPGSPPKEVAVKIMQLSGDDGRLRSLRQELASLRAIQSVSIPEVYDWSLDGNQGFVAMELFTKGTVRDQLADEGAASEDQAWRLLRDLLVALRDAHAASVLHLDIKPSNVLVREDGGYVLTDFGISQGAQATGGLRSVGRGTPFYYAPEQRFGDRPDYDMRTDLYGVGATVWSAYTCVNLASKRARSVVSDSADEMFGLPRPTTFRTFTSDALEEILMSLLVQDPRRRPGSAAEVLARMAALRDPSQIQTMPGVVLSEEEASEVVLDLIDPLWSQLFRDERRGLRRVASGAPLCIEGDRSHFAFVLLRGSVEVVIGDRVVAIEQREGTFLGEVSALTGKRRTATMRARGDVVLRVMNASQLERFVTRNPAVGVRLIRAMAQRLDRS